MVYPTQNKKKSFLVYIQFVKGMWSEKQKGNYDG